MNQEDLLTKTKNNYKLIKSQIMKKSFLTIGLFSLMMVLTSFTSLEIGGNNTAPKPMYEIGGNNTAPKPMYEIGGNNTAPKPMYEIGGNNTAPKPMFEIGGNNTAPKPRF